MKVAIIGGTGTLGSGLALRLSSLHSVSIGSRDEERGVASAHELSSACGRTIEGGLNEKVARECDAALLPVSYTAGMEVLTGLEEALKDKLVISPVVPMALVEGRFCYTKETGSAAEQIASILKDSRVAAALHTVPAPRLLKADVPLDMDTLVAADSRQTFTEVAGLLSAIEGLRFLYSGQLSSARSLEQLTPLLLNLARSNGLKSPALKLV
ncbi:MAG TPA: NADPH-dependent F420 reductase [Nitrososphaerales archaeon]|nr:NADPH-dependent F420 reductase [Nitrososphaerales archaeon]